MKKPYRGLSAEEVQLRLKLMEKEDEEIAKLLDEIIDTCESCGRRTKDGADAGCVPCIARDVMNR
jgi:hypothetical protein